MVRAIGNDKDSSLESEKQFTPNGATKMLPLVRKIVDDMVTLHKHIERQREQLREIDSLPDTIEQPNYQEELRDIRDSLIEDEARLEACVGELTALGVTPHRPIDGTVDFPATLNRRQVNLCWHPEEETVGFWHEIDGHKNRQGIEDQTFDKSLN